MSRQPRFEIVRTDAGWVGRYRSANGRICWVTESHTRKRGVENAVETMTGRFIYRMDGAAFITSHGGAQVAVRYLDERHPEATL